MRNRGNFCTRKRIVIYFPCILFCSMRYLILLVSLVVIAFSTWASAPFFWFPLGGMSQKDISDMYASAITPASFTFSIWSLIYLSWIIVGLVIAFSKWKKWTWISEKAIIPLSLAIGITAIWLVPWSYNWIGVSLVIMLILLGTLKYTFHLTRKDSWLVRSSVELFIGWINIATVANITVWLLYSGFTGWNIPEVYWAIGVLGLACLLTLYYQYRYHAYFVSLVFLWAMFGEWFAQTNMLQRNFIIGYGIVVIFMMIYTFSLKKKA